MYQREVLATMNYLLSRTPTRSVRLRTRWRQRHAETLWSICASLSVRCGKSISTPRASITQTMAPPIDLYPIDTGRLRATLDLAAEKAGWGQPLPLGHCRGIDGPRSFVTY